MLRRFTFILLGFLVAPLLIEGALQLIALFVGGDRSAALRGGERLRILCLGDSHTYGVYFLPEQSYPGQLKQLLNDPSQPPQCAVINAGLPGRNTPSMLSELPALLERYRPDVVVALGGINDRWNASHVGDQEAGEPPFWQTLRDRSRLVKLIRIARSRLTRETAAAATDLADPEIEPRYRAEPGEQHLSDTEAQRVTSTALARLVEQCRRAGATPVLLTYAASERVFQAAQLGIREAAAQTGALLIDIEEVFRQSGATDLLIPKDLHPTVRGYGVIARAIAERLFAEQILDQPPREPVAVEAAPPPLTLERERIADANGGRGVQALIVTGQPGTPFRILFSNATEPPLRLFRMVIPLKKDPLFGLALRMHFLAGRLDATGRAVVPLNATPFSRMGNTHVYACAVTLVDDGATRHKFLSVVSVSPAIEIK